MRKLFLLMALVLTASIAANAQFKFGVKAAANFATTNGEGDEMKVGFSGGLLGNIAINERWAIQPEALFNMQGPKSGDLKMNLAYVAVPVMVQFKIVDGLFVEAGPQLGILVSAKYKADGESVDIKEAMKTVEGAINMGVGYELQDVPVGFFFRTSLGVTGIGKEDYGFDPATNNLCFQLGAFVKF